MLTYINIKNFAIIKELEIDLQQKMTVLTGETGAGKSIIIDTLEFVFGSKANSSLIHHNADRAEITLMFDITNNLLAKQWLIDQELDSEEECIIRRVIGKDGRSKCSINSNACTQQTIRTLKDFLIDIHGQHEHQLLLNNERQRDLLDAYINCQELSTKIKQIYFSWLKAKKTLIDKQSANENYSTKIDFLNHQLKEFVELNFNPNELNKLRNEQLQLCNAEELTQTLNNTLNILTENEANTVIAQLHNAKNLLEKHKKIDAELVPAIELLNHAVINTGEAVKTLRQRISSTEFNQDRLGEVELQLTAIYDLARKHHAKPEELPQVQKNIEEQLARITNSSSDLQQLETEIKQLEKEYLTVATELSKNRIAGVAKLNLLITKKMQDLGMQGSAFAIHLEPNYKQNFSSSGLEQVSFLVSTNPGQPLQPLSKIASGGELSRISLAIQVELAEKEVTPTLVFDEIDSGVGGKTAEIVGQTLRKLGRATQVICVTHLPQVAAQGHQHLSVSKLSNNNNTEVVITNLKQKERVNEIARMLGGITITKQTLAHAEEMLTRII